MLLGNTYLSRTQFRPFTLAKPRDIQNHWFAALDSGDFRQTDGTLSHQGAHCCLGVANVALELAELHSSTLKHTYQKLFLRSCEGSRVDIPFDDAEITMSEFSCVDLNDSEALTFKEISHIIRRFRPLYFTTTANTEKFKSYKRPFKVHTYAISNLKRKRQTYGNSTDHRRPGSLLHARRTDFKIKGGLNQR